MRTCLGILVLIFTIVATIVTVVYHTTINSHLSFRQKQDHTDYINTQRSYRPPAPVIPATPANTTQPAP